LGHLNNHSIHLMATKQLAEGMPIDLSTIPPSCKSCVLGKQTRSSVPKVREGKRASKRLEIVSVDLTGPEDVVSASGNHYMMSIVDEYTCMPFVKPLKAKDASFEKIKAW
ncbi:hypothetical protein IW262DRAFT_1247641, partial [Armillaria fumosa]